MKDQVDTIAAQATPAGRGGVGIVRISGPMALKISQEVLGKTITPRVATFGNFFDKDKQIIDRGIALYFHAPQSLTGEDVVELHGHGGQAVIRILLQRVLELGARLAKPGEFTERAFFNNKIDLVQAEAVVDLVNAATHQAAQSAARSLSGEFSCEINKIKKLLIELRVKSEAAIDFIEEDGVANIAEGALGQDIEELLQKIGQLKKSAKQGALLRDGIMVVIAGDTNAGKSSLLNCLCGQEEAIVTDIPGTTRDVLKAWIQLDGVPINLLDTAGLRKDPGIIEAEGIRRAREEIKKADHILFMIDAVANRESPHREEYRKFLETIPEGKRLTILYNKIDLTGEEEKIVKQEGVDCIYLSVKERKGIDLLREHIKEKAGLCNVAGGVFSARKRHLMALDLVEEYLGSAEEDALRQGRIELACENIKKAQEALGDIVGDFTTEDLLERIFSEFCIGK